MAKRVQVRLVGEDKDSWGTWRNLPEDWSVERLRDRPESELVPFAEGGEFKRGELAEWREVDPDGPEPPPDEDMRDRAIREAREKHENPKPQSPSDYST
jgi:hypothetical protein